MAKQSATQSAPVSPGPFDRNDFSMIEMQLRELADCLHLIQRCERCNLPVSEAKADCEHLISFFQGLLQEFKGPQAPTGHP